MDIAKIYYDNHKDVVAVSSGFCFEYNDAKKLWLKRSNKKMAMKMCIYLTSKDASLKSKLADEPYRNNVWRLTKQLFANDGDKLNKMVGYLAINNNKVINLRNGVVSDREKTHYFTHETRVDYVKDTPMSDKFFGEMKNVSKIQKALGYCMTGEHGYVLMFCGTHMHNDALKFLSSVLNLKYFSNEDDYREKRATNDYYYYGLQVAVLREVTLHGFVDLMAENVDGPALVCCCLECPRLFDEVICLDMNDYKDKSMFVTIDMLEGGGRSDIFSWIVKGAMRYYAEGF